MKVFWKYLLWLLSFFTLIIYYLFYTSLGHKTISDLVGNYLSERTGNHLEVASLNIKEYPFITMKVIINNGARVDLDGRVSIQKLNLDYHLVGDSLDYNSFHLKDEIDIKGNMSGKISELLITGQGEIFNGTTQFNLVKTSTHLKDININLKDVNAQKVLTFLHKKPMIKGKADIDANFIHYAGYKKDGDVLIHMKEAFIPAVVGTVPLALKTKIKFADLEYFYDAGIKSKIGTCIISDGSYHKSKKEAKAHYIVDIKELAYFKKIFRRTLKGKFASSGTITYSDKKFFVTGTTKQFGGLAEYIYEQKNLKVNMEGVSLVKALKLFSYPTVLSSDIYGTVDFNLKDKMVFINTRLKKTQFRKNKMTDMIFQSTGIDVLKDFYDNSSFVGGYQNSILHSTLIIDNGVKHLYLTNTRMDSKANTIDSDFKLKIDGEEIYGEIYGTLKNPKFSIDVQKFIKRKLSETLGKWGGKEKREAVSRKLTKVKEDVSRKLKEIDVDKIKKKTRHFLNGFFEQ